jgi:hypothetical protein
VNARFTEQDYGLSLLSSMYHQDWRHAGEHAAILDIFLWERQVPPAVLALRDDALSLSRLTDSEIEAVWAVATNGNFEFDLDVGSGSEWMRFIVERCHRWFTDHDLPVPATNSSAPDHSQAELVAERIGFIVTPREVDDPPLSLARAGLMKCAELGSPSLALRLLVRTIDSRQIELSHERYAELGEIGEALNCGEFVVSAIGYLAHGT